MMNYVTNAKAMKMMEEIIAEHAPDILGHLGFYNDDEILGKFTISTENNDDTPRGVCSVTTSRTLLGLNEKYVKGSAEITFYPVAFFSYRKKNRRKGNVPFFFRFFSKRIRKTMIFVLAHELRHYWQYDSGEYYRNESQAFGISIMPYEWRWCEKDANDFAREYMKSIGMYKDSKMTWIKNKAILYPISIAVGAGIGTAVSYGVKQLIKLLMH